MKNIIALVEENTLNAYISKNKKQSGIIITVYVTNILLDVEMLV